MSLSVLSDIKFAADSNTTAGAAGTSTGAGHGLVDVQGGVASVAAGQLVLTADSVDGSQFKRDFLLSPASVDQQDQYRDVFVPPGGADSNSVLDLCLRFQRSTKDHYLLSWITHPNYATQNLLQIYTLTGGAATVTTLASSSDQPIYDPTHGYRLSGSVVGANPTVATLSLFDLGAASSGVGTQIGTVTVSDSTAGLQNSSASAVGIFSSGSTVSTSLKISEILDQTSTPPAAGPTLTFDDQFGRADSATVGSGWSDLSAKWSIGSRALKTTSIDFGHDLLLRPASESMTDSQADVVATAMTQTDNGPAVPFTWLRASSAKNGYAAWAGSSGPNTTLNIGIMMGGTLSGVVSSPTFPATVGTQYNISFSAIGTKLTASIAASSTPGTILGTISLTDSTYTSGVAALSPNGTNWNVVNRFTTYSGVTTANAITPPPPTMANPPVASAVAVLSSDSTGWNLQANSTGGAGGNTYQWLSSANPDGPFAAVTGATTQTHKFQVAGGAAPLFVQCQVTDSAGGSATSFGFAAGSVYTGSPALPFAVVPVADPYQFVLVSDSTATTAQHFDQATFATVLAGAFLPASVSINNQAVAGTTAQGWDASLAATMIGNLAAGKYLFLIDLGVNDAKASGTNSGETAHLTASSYSSHIASICQTILGTAKLAGSKIILMGPGYVAAPTQYGQWDDASISLLLQYGQAIPSLCNGTSILNGMTTQRFYSFAANPALFSDGVHETILGGTDLAVMYAASVIAALTQTVPGTATNPGTGSGLTDAQLTLLVTDFAQVNAAIADVKATIQTATPPLGVGDVSPELVAALAAPTLAELHAPTTKLSELDFTQGFMDALATALWANASRTLTAAGLDAILLEAGVNLRQGMTLVHADVVGTLTGPGAETGEGDFSLVVGTSPANPSGIQRMTGTMAKDARIKVQATYPA